MSEQPVDATRFYSHMTQLMKEGRNSEAVRLLRKHLDAHPTDSNALHLYASAAYGDGNYHVAEKVFRHMASLPGAHTVTHYSLGLSLEKSGRDEDALVAFERALETDRMYGPAAEKVAALRQKLYGYQSSTRTPENPSPYMQPKPDDPMKDLVPGGMVPRKALKGIWIAQITILSIAALVVVGIFVALLLRM